MGYGQILFLVFAALLAVLPSVMSRKCYICDSGQNPACADGYQTGQMQYSDCSQMGQMGGQYGQQGGIGGGINPQLGGVNPQINPAFPQQQGQYGQSGYGGDKCTKTTSVGLMGSNQQPLIRRGCGTATGFGTGGDSCYWQGQTQICTCDSNYCNSSPNLNTWTKPALISTALFTFFASLLYRQNL